MELHHYLANSQFEGDLLVHESACHKSKHLGFAPSEAGLRQKAGAALRHFEAAPLTLRRAIVKQLIREFINIESNSLTKNTGDVKVSGNQQQRSIERFSAVRDAWNATLQILTKKRIQTPSKWQDFYNDDAAWKSNWDKVTSKSKSKRKPKARRKAPRPVA